MKGEKAADVILAAAKAAIDAAGECAGMLIV